jgi:hypothetical protein
MEKRQRRLSTSLGDEIIHAQKAHRPRIAKKMGVVEIVPDDPTLSLQPLSQVCVAEY